MYKTPLGFGIGWRRIPGVALRLPRALSYNPFGVPESSCCEGTGDRRIKRRTTRTMETDGFAAAHRWSLGGKGVSCTDVVGKDWSSSSWQPQSWGVRRLKTRRQHSSCLTTPPSRSE